MRDLRVEDMKGITIPVNGSLLEILCICAERHREIIMNERDNGTPARKESGTPNEEDGKSGGSSNSGDEIDRSQPHGKETGTSAENLRIKLNVGALSTHDFVKEETSSRRNKKRKQLKILDDDDEDLDDQIYIIPDPCRRNFVNGETSTGAARRNKKKNKGVRETDQNQNQALQAVPEIKMPYPEPSLPESFKNVLLSEISKGRHLSEGKLVIQKILEDTDFSRQHNRLSIPENNIKEWFLKDEEVSYLCRRMINNSSKWNYIMAKIVEPSLEVGEVKLTRWPLKKEGGKGSVMYVLNGTWNKMAARNGLIKNMIVQVWAFRVDHEELCFALVKL